MNLKYKLIGDILNLLYKSFPNWKTNKYYKNNYIDFEVTDTVNILKAKSIVKKYERG